MRLCYNADSPAPRTGCDCGECARARQHTLDPRLFEIVRHDWKTPSRTSRHIIHQHIHRYLAGQVERADLLINIIQSLSAHNDAMFERVLQMEMLKPTQPVVAPSDPA